MNGTPFAPAATSIGVTVVTTGPVAAPPEGVALIRLEPGPHEHPPGQECIACATASDIRALLFDLLNEQRAGTRSPFSRVIVDATRLRDPQPVIDRLDPASPAVGLRDFTVARSFHLSGVI